MLSKVKKSIKKMINRLIIKVKNKINSAIPLFQQVNLSKKGEINRVI